MSLSPMPKVEVQKHTSAPLSMFTPDARFGHVHIYIVGPLPYACTFRHLLTAVDRFIRWPEANGNLSG